jgi:dCTP deaminase
VILSDRDISAAVGRGAIVLDPFRPECLGPNSYDVHLGSTILVYTRKQAYDPHGPSGPFDPIDAREDNPVEELYPDRPAVPQSWLLMPCRVYLAVTEEYTETHEHIPYLDGKSSVGRLGVAIHATAGRGDIGFCNHWTMELVVAQPVIVYAGMPIGQLTYHQATSRPENPYGSRAQSKYQGRDPRPQPSRMWKNFK